MIRLALVCLLVFDPGAELLVLGAIFALVAGSFP